MPRRPMPGVDYEPLPPRVPTRPSRPKITVRIEPQNVNRDGVPTASTEWNLRLWLEAPAEMGGEPIESLHYSRHGSAGAAFKSQRAAKKAARGAIRRLTRVGRRWMRDKALESIGSTEWEVEVP